jgi:hypothetical protein
LLTSCHTPQAPSLLPPTWSIDRSPPGSAYADYALDPETFVHAGMTQKVGCAAIIHPRPSTRRVEPDRCRVRHIGTMARMCCPFLMMLCSLALVACAPLPDGVVAPQTSGPVGSSPIVVRSPGPDCSNDHINLAQLSNHDSGRTYQLAPCQGVTVYLTHEASDGCGWATVQTSNDVVMKLLPIPLPAPPPGGTIESYRAVRPGRAELHSSLLCGTDNGPKAAWQITIVVVSPSS